MNHTVTVVLKHDPDERGWANTVHRVSRSYNSYHGTYDLDLFGTTEGHGARYEDTPCNHCQPGPYRDIKDANEAAKLIRRAIKAGAGSVEIPVCRVAIANHNAAVKRLGGVCFVCRTATEGLHITGVDHDPRGGDEFELLICDDCYNNPRHPTLNFEVTRSDGKKVVAVGNWRGSDGYSWQEAREPEVRSTTENIDPRFPYGETDEGDQRTPGGWRFAKYVLAEGYDDSIARYLVCQVMSLSGPCAYTSECGFNIEDRVLEALESGDITDEACERFPAGRTGVLMVQVTLKKIEDSKADDYTWGLCEGCVAAISTLPGVAGPATPT